MSVARQQVLLSKVSLDGMIAVSPQNVTYTAQFKIPSHGVVPDRLAFTLVTKDKSYLLVANMEETTAKRYAKVDEVVAYREFEESATDKLAALISDMGLSKVAIEQHHISSHDFVALKERLVKIRWEDSTALFQQLRTIKEPWEVELLTQLAQLATSTHREVKNLASIGIMEIELWSEIMRLLVRGGVEKAIIPCVGFGDRSTFPNAPPTQKKLASGDIVRIDIIATMRGYLSDIARTYIAQTVTNEHTAMWKNLVEIHKNLLDLISPGRETREIYEAYEQAYKKLGLPVSAFVGHGLGLDVHEPPFVGKYHNSVLEPGMVLCIEPFVFLEDRGYHIEDTILVTDKGHKLLSSFEGFTELPVLCI